MKRIAIATTMLALAAAALGTGYWWGANRQAAPAVQGAAQHSPAQPERRILYYRNPMGLPDISPVPKKDPMGMDYIPVYEGEEPEGGETLVKISLDRVQKLGVKTEAAAARELQRTVRAVGALEANERQLYTVTPKFEGWIQKLHVNATGEPVRRGQPLMDVYSPDLITAQQEYLIAWKGLQAVKEGAPEIQESMQRLVESTLQRLRNWDISELELLRLQRDGQVTQFLTLRSPVDGVVLEKPALQGMRFMPGEVLYRIANLASVWLLVDVFEQDLALVRLGQPARIRIDAYPDKVFGGKVVFIYPTVAPETRTAKVRIELPNPGGLLKLAMYARVEIISSPNKTKVLAVPDSAVLDSGVRQVVLVERGEGLYEPREVKLGARADGYVEVLEGVKEGERVVVSANFLIDAESNLKAALGAFGHGAHGSKPGEDGQVTPAAPAATPSPAAHRGEGSIETIDLSRAMVKLAHGPIDSLQWPAMTMDFRVKDTALLQSLKPGQKIAFELVEEAGGEYVIARIQPAGASPAASGPISGHKGH